MIADYLHSFYRMPMNIVIGGVPTVVTLRWYKAPAGAKPLPFPSFVFSHVWDNNPGESLAGELGEVGYPRTWDAGTNPGYQGQCYRGNPQWFQTGLLPPLASIAPSPCLCQIPPAQAAGGLVLGGAASATVGSLCGFCPGGTAPSKWTATVSGGVNAWASVNGTVTMVRISPCVFRAFSGANGYVLGIGQLSPPGNWSMQLFNGTNTQNYGNVGPGNCWGVVAPWSKLPFVIADAPTSISVQPAF